MPTARLVPLAALLVLGVGAGPVASLGPAAPVAAAPAAPAASAVPEADAAPTVVRPAANSWTRKSRTSVRRTDTWTGSAPTVRPAANSWTRKARPRAFVLDRAVA